MPETAAAPALVRRVRARWRPLTGVVLVLLLAASWVLVGQPEPEQEVSAPPRANELAQAERGCPPARQDGARVLVGSVRTGASGPVVLDPGGRVRVPAAGVAGTAAPEQGTVVRGTGETAPGLVATLLPGEGVAAVGCPAPRPDQWFLGLGARPGAAGTLHLVNPDDGRAVAELTVLGVSGERDVGTLRAVTVPGGGVRSLQLADLAPTRQDVAVRVEVTRGRLAASAAVTVDELGLGPSGPSRDAVPRAAVGSRATVLGLPSGAGERQLVVANPGEDEVRLEPEAVRDGGVVAPSGARAVRIPPGRMRSVPLGSLLGEQDPGEVDGIRLTSAEGRDFVAGVRSLVRDDVAVAPALPALQRGVVLLPRGGARLDLLGSGEPTTARVRAWNARGRAVLDRRVRVSEERAGRVSLPARARRVTVRAGADVRAAAALTDPQGAAVLPVRQPPLTDLRPAVRPALP